MKRMFLALALSAFSAATFAQQKPAAAAGATKESLPIGSAIPMATTKMTGMDKAEVTLAGSKTDKGLLVMFSCNTCPYVIKAENRTQDAIADAKALGIGMVIINSNAAQRGDVDSREKMIEYGKPKYGRVPYLVDENAKVADAFGATRTPEVFLFDGSGKLVYKGALEDNPGEPAQSTKFYLRDAMKRMSVGMPIETPSTKSIGCSIKR